MICSFCGKTFDEESALKQCSQCSLFGGCERIKCPHCGYESPREPKSLKWLKEIRTKKK